jgi:hypothetical protein
MRGRMLRKVIFTLWLYCGYVFASYGVLRESFADFAQKSTYGAGRYGGGYGEELTSYRRDAC